MNFLKMGKCVFPHTCVRSRLWTKHPETPGNLRKPLETPRMRSRKPLGNPFLPLAGLAYKSSGNVARLHLAICGGLRKPFTCAVGSRSETPVLHLADVGYRGAENLIRRHSRTSAANVTEHKLFSPGFVEHQIFSPTAAGRPAGATPRGRVTASARQAQ